MMMKKFGLFSIVLFLSVILFAHQEQYQVTVRNIEVPVRVFQNDQFVSDLTIDDFEIYENGIPQKIEALYLADKKGIIREEEQKKFSPQTTRHFFLLFQILDYNPKLEESMEYFFKNVLLPEDTLTIQTPQKPYHLTSQALAKRKKEDIAHEMLKLLRKDTKISSSAYRSQMRSLQGIVREISGGTSGIDVDTETDVDSSSSLGMLLRRYKQNLEKMEQLRMVNQDLFIQFAAQLKKIPGQKYVYFFYEREYRPELSPAVTNTIVSNYQSEPSILGDLQDLFQAYQRHERVNAEKINEAFADASICFNFLFVDREENNSQGVYMREQSEDYFRAFSETAKTTGGVVDSSHNPSLGFMNALESTERYYLLYYSPQNYQADKSYKKIEVRVKNRDCKLTFRHGYIAD
jgi:VWFA-related protein